MDNQKKVVNQYSPIKEDTFKINRFKPVNNKK